MRIRDSVLVLAVAFAAGIGAFLVNFNGTPAMAQDGAAAGGLIALKCMVSTSDEDIVIIDTSKKIMAVYAVSSRKKPSIELKAARDISFDLQVPEFNTEPSPAQIEREVKKLQKESGN